MADKDDDQRGKPEGNGDDDPQDGSQGAWQPPKDGSWIPKARFDEAVNDLKGKLSALEARLTAKGEEKPPEKKLTRAELNGLVESGKITQEAADNYWDDQQRKTITEEVTRNVTSSLSQRERQQTTASLIGEYKTLVPEAWSQGTKERSKAEREYQALIALGFPDTQATEVAAMRAAFGDPAQIRESRNTGRRGPGETHVETGGGEPADRGKGGDEDGPPKGLEKRKADYYQKQIDKGYYPDWKAVREELSYKPPHLRPKK